MHTRSIKRSVREKEGENEYELSLPLLPATGTILSTITIQLIVPRMTVNHSLAFWQGKDIVLWMCLRMSYEKRAARRSFFPGTP